MIFFYKFDSLFYSLQSEPRGSYWGMHLHMFYDVFIIQYHLCCRTSIFFYSKISFWFSVATLKMRPYTSYHLLNIKVLNICIESFLKYSLLPIHVISMFLVMKALSLELLQLYNLLNCVVSSLYRLYSFEFSAWCLCHILCLTEQS